MTMERMRRSIQKRKNRRKNRRSSEGRVDFRYYSMTMRRMRRSIQKDDDKDDNDTCMSINNKTKKNDKLVRDTIAAGVRVIQEQILNLLVVIVPTTDIFYVGTFSSFVFLFQHFTCNGLNLCTLTSSSTCTKAIGPNSSSTTR